MTAEEIRIMTAAVAMTFCRGNRRPSANRVEAVANTRNHSSSQPPRGDESIRKKIKTKLASQQPRQAIKTGLCQQRRDGEGTAICGAATLPSGSVTWTSDFPSSAMTQNTRKRLALK